MQVERIAGSGGSVTWNNYVYAGGGIAAVFYERISGGGTSQTRYFHKDHLGSIAVITDELGAVAQRLAYDAWGKRRNTNGTDEPLANSIPSLLDQGAQTDRGFTGHEHLQELALVHMNGRIYDPLLGRFLSADPSVQDPTNGQSFNRYSYVQNNPLAYTDPSGYFSIGSIFKSIKHFFSQPIVAMVIGIAVAAIITGGLSLGPTLATSLATWQGAVIAGGVSGLLTGGPLGLVTGAAMGALTFGIGQAPIAGFGTDMLGLAAGGDGAYWLGIFGKAAMHGIAQGGFAEAQGGSFGPAFLAAAFSKVGGATLGSGLNGLGMGDNSFERVVVQGVGTAVIGGTASVIGGGKFQNGAASAAFVYMFNQATQRTESEQMRDAVLKGLSLINPGQNQDGNIAAYNANFSIVADPAMIDTNGWQRSLSFHSEDAIEKGIPGYDDYRVKMYLKDDLAMGMNTVTITTPSSSAAHFWYAIPFYLNRTLPINSSTAKRFCSESGGCQAR